MVELKYGPVTQEEIDFYRKRLTADGANLINHFQLQLIGYVYYKEFGDPITFKSIRNTTDYIKLIICAKRMLAAMGMVLLPYVFSSRVMRQAARKIISRKDVTKYERTPLYEAICRKYNNDKSVIQKIWEFIGMVASSTFQIIDYDLEKHAPTQYNGQNVPMINDIIYEEMMLFILYI